MAEIFRIKVRFHLIVSSIVKTRLPLFFVALLSIALLCAEGVAPTRLHAQSQDSISVSISLSQGWNLSSIPVQADDQSFGSLLPPCQSGFFFEPGSGYSTIGSSESVPPGRAIFGNCSADTISVKGVPADSSSIAVDEGWNVIGALDDTVSTDAITSSPEGIVQTSFFKFQRGYQAADSLYPGRGYWVKVGQQGELDLSTLNFPPPPSPSSQAESNAVTGPKMPRFVITDAQGRSATLHLITGTSASPKQEFELPPKPPSDLFDVRFAGGYAAVSLGKQGSGPLPDVELQGLKFPVEVRLEGSLPRDQRLRLSTQADQAIQLTSRHRTGTIRTSTSRLQLTLQATPAAFALEKSRPHPVTRRATIEYAVAIQTEVSIEVFDALGRRVMELVDGRRQVGAHRVQVGAQRLPSGTYFVRMRAGAFRKTRRLTVVR